MKLRISQFKLQTLSNLNGHAIQTNFSICFCMLFMSVQILNRHSKLKCEFLNVHYIPVCFTYNLKCLPILCRNRCHIANKNRFKCLMNVFLNENHARYFTGVFEQGKNYTLIFPRS